jgi:hypothetical protein
MQLWDSREDLDSFNREVFFPSVMGLGDRGFTQTPVVRDIETAIAWIDHDRI